MSNKHKDIQDSQLHVCKGHQSANVGTYIVKDEVGSQIWESRPVLYPAISQVNPNAAPPTELTGDIYILTQAYTTLDVITIAWQSGTTVRYTLTGDVAMLAAAAVGHFAKIIGATNSKHNGRFAITNKGADWFEITNALVTGAGDNESSSPATTTIAHANWDTAITNDWVRFNGTLWYGISPFEGLQVFDKNINAMLVFNGTSWTTSTVAAASETVAGIIEIATQTETNNGIDDQRAVTPFKLIEWWNYIKTLTATITGIWYFYGEKFRIVRPGFATYTSLTTNVAVNQTWTIPDEGDQTFASRTYVDNVAVGLKWKQPVVVATTAAGVLTTGFENGDTIDGIVLVTGDRILIKNQTSAIENGIYIVSASGAPTRATDADTGSELISAAVFIQKGTANADKAFVCTNDAITIGTTDIIFTGFASVIGALIASNNLSDVASASTSLANIGGEASANKDTSGGYIGLLGWKIKFRNLANTFTSYFENSATASRTYTFPDKDITVAGIVDVDAKKDTFAFLCLYGGATVVTDSSIWHYFNSGNAPTAGNIDTNNDYNFGFACTLIGATIDVYGNTTAGSNENITVELRNTTAATTSSIGTFQSSGGSATVTDHFTFTGLNIAIGASDNVCLKITNPLWATNPVGTVYRIVLYFRKE